MSENLAFDSAKRLLHLGRIADSASTAARDAQNRRNTIASEANALRREQAQFGPGEIHRDDKRFADLGQQIEALDAERAALDLAYREAANRAADALRLHESCDVYAHQNGLPRPSALSSAAAAPSGVFQ